MLRLVREQANRSGRGRLRSDTSLRATYYPRGVLIGTAEQLPTSVQSITARMLAIEIGRGDVNMDNLNASQAEAHLYPNATAGFLNWLTRQWDDLRNSLPQAWKDTRSKKRGLDQHLRMPEMFASLYLAFDLVLRYAVEIGAATDDEAGALLTEAGEVFAALTDAQAKRIQTGRPTERFLGIIQELLAQGKAHIEPCPRPHGWYGDGERLGWQDEDYVDLLSETCFQIVARTCRDQGEYFPIKSHALHRMLLAEGYLVPPKANDEGDSMGQQEGRLTTQVKRGAKKARVLRLVRKRLGW